MLFFLSIVILLISVLLVVSLFRLERISETILAWALSAYANIVLVFQLANLLHKINSISTVLLIQGVILLAAGGLWFLFGRPRLLPEFTFQFRLAAYIREKKNWPVLALIGALAAVLALYVVLIYIVPPNNNDALSIHIARIIKWKQMGSYFPWETPFIWQVTFPVNAQLTYLWTILFTGADHFIAFIPCLAGLITALLVYLFARMFGFGKRVSLFSGLIWLTLPVVQLHLTSVRHDLVSTWLFISTLYFFARWAISRQRVHMLLSALSLGLVIGTNFSIATYLPGLAILLLFWLVFRRFTVKQMLIWGGSVIVAFLIFSSPIFISNWVHFRSPVGPDAAAMTSAAVGEEMSIGNYLLINITRWCYQLLDFSWLPKPLGAVAVNLKAWLANNLSALFGAHFEGDLATLNAHEFYWHTLYQLQEDEAWFGLIGAGLIFPTSLVAFVQGWKKKQVLLLAPFVFFVTALITCSLIRPGWTPYDGRYFMPLAALCTALLPMWFKGKKSGPILLYLVLGLSLFSMMMVVAFNPAKQVVGGAAVWNMNRIDRMTRQSYTSKEMIYLVEGSIPKDAVVGVATNNFDYQEYGIFGEHFTRSIVNVYPPDRVGDAAWLEGKGVDYLLILVTEGYPVQIADGFEYVDSLGDWVVYSNVRAEYRPVKMNL